MAAVSKKILDIYVGVSGTGKSTLIGARDGGKTSGNAGCESGTKLPGITQDITNPSLWMIDTQGICDSKADETGDHDSVIKRQIFQKMKKEGAKWIRVVWTVRPGDKALSHLKRLAKFIHTLGETEGVIAFQDIWKSVIILCKKGSDEDDLLGPVGAACHAMKSSRYSYPYKQGHERTILTRVVTILDNLKPNHRDLKLAKKIDREERFAEGLIWMKEVGDWQRSVFRNVEPVQVVFQHRHCRKCGERGDPREFDQYCHSRFEHSGSPVTIRGKTRYYHTGTWSEATAGGKAYMMIHPFGLVAQAVSGTVRGKIWGNWPCCGSRDRYSRGCKSSTESYEEHSICGCLRFSSVQSCPDPDCRDCGRSKGTRRSPGARCRGSHHWW